MNYRFICVKRLEYVLKHLLEDENLQLSMYGSCMSGLSLPTSDIDLSLCGYETNSK